MVKIMVIKEEMEATMMPRRKRSHGDGWGGRYANVI